MDFDRVATRLLDLRGRLDELPSGPDSLIPVFADDRLRPRLTASATARPAAVLVLIVPGSAGEARLILTERLTYDGHHSGQVSFPGGKAEPADPDPAATALREAAEEVELDAVAAGVMVVGRSARCSSR